MGFITTLVVCFIGQLLQSTGLFVKPIVEGQIAKYGWFPFQVYLWSSPRKCGGVLISDRWILSAAHCVSIGHRQKLDQVEVYLGYVSLRNATNAVKQIVKKNFIYIPEGYWREEQDLSAIYLPRNLRPVALHKYDRKPYPTYEGIYALASGWGSTEISNEDYNHLRYKWVLIINNTECSRQGNVEGHIPWIMCGRPYSICHGDSGGPLVHIEGSTYYLIGISFSVYGGCKSNVPVSFTRITYFRDWIQYLTGI